VGGAFTACHSLVDGAPRHVQHVAYLFSKRVPGVALISGFELRSNKHEFASAKIICPDCM